MKMYEVSVMSGILKASKVVCNKTTNLLQSEPTQKELHNILFYKNTVYRFKCVSCT